jgi:hypothetical protein
VYDERIYNCCARARFAGCTYLRNIILALNTVQTNYADTFSMCAMRLTHASFIFIPRGSSFKHLTGKNSLD